MAVKKFSAIGAAGAVTGTDKILGVQTGPIDVVYTVANLLNFTLAQNNTWVGAQTFSNYITVQGGVYANQTTTGLALGTDAGLAKRNGATGSDDVFVGFAAGILVPNGQTFHTFVGAYTGAAATAGTGGTAIGQKSLESATTISRSTGVGAKSGSRWITTTDDLLMGYGAGQFSNLTNVGRRTFIGVNAGDMDNGDLNIYLGYGAGQHSGQSATSSQRNIGIGALTFTALNSGISNIGIGYQALTAVISASGNVAIGDQAGVATTAGSNTFVGYNAGFTNITGGSNVYIGIGAGNNAPTSLSNSFISGNDGSSGGNRIDNVWFGKGYAAATPTAYALNGTGGSGADIAGGGLILAGGKGTGTGVSGFVKLQYAPAGSTSSTLNSLVDGLQLTTLGSIVLGNAALTTNASAGFLYIPTCAGTPVGTPTAFTGRVALIYDTTNHQLWVYDASWLQPKTPAAAAVVNWQ